MALDCVPRNKSLEKYDDFFYLSSFTGVPMTNMKPNTYKL
jgi:hypothetical protein